jgi:hypothetical protein
MTTVMKRIRSKASDLSDARVPDTGDLRERLKDIVEEAVDRVGDLVDRDSASGAARSVSRNARLADLAPAALVAVGPGVVRALRERHQASRSSAVGSVLAVVPMAVTRRRALMGGGVVAGMVAGVMVARWAYRRRSARRRAAEELAMEHDAYVQSVDPGRFDLEAEVARMEGEGGEPASGSGDDDAGSAASPSRRRFVRSSSSAS